MTETIKRLKTHISSLEKAYNNIIEVMNSDVDKDDEGKVKLKDDKIKTYAEGLEKSAKTITFLFDQITCKKKDLQELFDKKKGEPKKDNDEEKKVPKKSNLNKHLK